MRPGDIILVHPNSFYSKLIGFGQLHHFKGPAHYCYWTHTAVVTSYTGDIIEAKWPHVRRSHIDIYKNCPCEVVDISEYVKYDDRKRVVAFADHCVGREYGIIEAISLGGYCLVGGPFRFGIDNQLICSALAAEALCRTDIIFPEEPLWMFPAHLAQFFNVSGLAK